RDTPAGASKGTSHRPEVSLSLCRIILAAGGPYRPMDTFTELQELADDLTELGDNATAALVRQAIDRFSAWKFEAGEELLEKALEERRKHEREPPRSPYFNTCALVV